MTTTFYNQNTTQKLRITRFPYDYEATHFLASPQLQTPWLVFQDEWHNTSQTKMIQNVTKKNQKRNHSFHAMPGCHHLVSGTFHPQINGFFSAFPRGTKYTIGLEKYSELEVDASQKDSRPISNERYSRKNDTTKAPQIYGTITLYG